MLDKIIKLEVVAVEASNKALSEMIKLEENVLQALHVIDLMATSRDDHEAVVKIRSIIKQRVKLIGNLKGLILTTESGDIIQ